MVTPQHQNLYTSSLLTTLPTFTHGFTTRHAGDMRQVEPKRALLADLGLSDRAWVMGEQIHGNRVAVVSGVAPIERIASVDGVLVDGSTFDVPPVVAVRVADCAPVLFADPKRSLYGAVHAGWRGTLGGAVCRMIEVMELRGSQKEDIRVAIGPCIGACCYTVDPERAAQFEKTFGGDSGVVSVGEQGYALDIAQANELLLIQSGLQKSQWDTARVCTASDIETWYSYRKDTKASFGEIAGFITLTV